MKKILLLLSLCVMVQAGMAQSDNCSTATILSVTANCSSPVNGTTVGATQSLIGCTGVADDDVWYQFTATGTSQYISITGAVGFDAVFEVFSGSCGSLVSLNCVDNTFSGGTESLLMSGLTNGATYLIRVYDYGTGTPGNFTICVSSPPTAPSNNLCGSPTALTVNTACSYTSGTTFGATQSYTGCVGTADDDVWYSFVANSSSMSITVDPSASMDAVVQLYSGSCGSLTSLQCVDAGFTNGNESVNAVGLVIGQTYLVRVYDYYGGNGYPFQICVTGTPPSGAPSNDNACGAIALPTVTSDCNYLVFSNANATETASPVPSSCAGGGGAMDGGFSTATIKDVWFSVVVPANGKITITAMPNMGVGYIADGVMALYTGSCGSLTQVACSDDNTAYPGSANDLLPYISASGLTPGSTVYIRYWGYGSSAAGNFGICVSSPTNDACANALYICDINGYGASTSAAYTPDRPGNMFGNNETSAGVDQPDGINTGGIFGQGGGWGTGSPFYDVNINNNSWIRFTAANTTAVLNVTIGNCWVGNYPSGGIQMQIFSGTNCTSFTPVSDFKEGSSSFTITANNLTIGQDYYLMVDGFAGDICNYTISANSGVQFPAITAVPDSVCPGGSSVLTGPAGATAYEWLPGGQTTQSITVTPPYSTTYTCIASGVCGYKQTLTKTVYIKPLPTVSINASTNYTVNVCGQQNTTLTATGAGSYTWNTGQSGASITVNPSGTTSYTVTGNLNGCTATSVATVNVLTLPGVAASGTSFCLNQSGTLSASGANTYSWSNGGSGTSISVNPTSTTTYTVTGTAANGCTNTATATATVLQLPAITASGGTICNGQSTSITASGGVSYSWNTGASGASVSVNPASTTVYTVTGTGSNGCTNTASATVNVNPLPVISITPLTLCSNASGTISASGAVSYSWNTGANGPSISVSNLSTNTTYTVTGTDANNCQNSTTVTVQVNAVPQLNGSPVITQSNCGQSTGAITGVNVSGSGALTYVWTNSTNQVVGNSANISGIPAGTYNLTVTDANGCSDVFSFSITNPGAPGAPTASVASPVICAGDNIQLSAGSVSNATYQWTGPNGFNSTNQNPLISPAGIAESGTYSVTVTVNNCTGPAGTVAVTVNPLPIVSAASQQSTYCSGDSIQLFGSGGTVYNWTGPNGFTSTTQNPFISNADTAAGGTFGLSVTDANGCINSASVALVVNPTPQLSGLTAQPNTIVCAGTTVTFNVTSTGNPTYSWTGPNGFTSSASSVTISNSNVTQSGTYTVIATENNCASAQQTINLLVNPLPNASASVIDPSICASQQIQLNASGGISYSWSGPNGFSDLTQSPAINNAGTNASGIYTVTVTDNNNCSSTATVSVTVNAPPAVNAQSSASSICSGGNIQLTASGGNSYNWTGPNGYVSSQQNPSISNAGTNSSGVYTVTVVDANGCTSSDTANITVIQTPQLLSTINDSTCNTGVLSLSATASTGTIFWYSDPGLSNLAGTGNSLSPTGLQNDSLYTFYAVAVNGPCSSTVSPVTAIVHSINAGINANPLTGVPPLNVSFINASTGLNNTPSYFWDLGNGNTANSVNTSDVYTNPGTYTVSLIVINTENLCQDTANVIVVVTDEISVVIPNVFTPNGDGINDFFTITVYGAKEVEGIIYNRWGQAMFNWTGSSAIWDGKTPLGINASEGTYFYMIRAKSYTNEEKEFKGYLLLTK